MAAEISAVNLNRAAHGRIRLLRRKGFADFVPHDVGRLVLAIEVAGELKGAMPFRAVDEDRYGEKIGRNRELSAGEDRAGRDRKLMTASFAFEQGPRLVGITGSAFAAGADRRAFRGSPADHLKAIVRLGIRHAGHLRQT